MGSQGAGGGEGESHVQGKDTAHTCPPAWAAVTSSGLQGLPTFTNTASVSIPLLSKQCDLAGFPSDCSQPFLPGGVEGGLWAGQGGTLPKAKPGSLQGRGRA
jgi:hypothetical protein